MHLFSKIVTLVLSILLSACTQFDRLSGAPAPAELQPVLAGTALISNPQEQPLLDGDILLATNDAMRSFVGIVTPTGLTNRQKLSRLLSALLDSDAYPLQYNAGVTFNAAETFELGRGNCVSLSALFIALAREAGLKAFFNEVDMPPTWDMMGENRFVFYKHVNVVIDLGRGEERVIELSNVPYNTHARQRPISDEQASAQYFNNLGVAHLADKDPSKAFHYFQSAIELAPRQSYLWANLGTLYRRHNELEAAETAYLQAHHLNPKNPVAISSLARLYDQMGKQDLAETFSSVLSKQRQQNPYYQYQQAYLALQSGSYDAALTHIQAALRENRRDHRFHHLLAKIHQEMGNLAKARKSLKRALALSGPSEQQRYQSQLEQLTTASR